MNSNSYFTLLVTLLALSDLSASECLDGKVRECIVRHMPTSQNPEKIPEPNEYANCIAIARSVCENVAHKPEDDREVTKNQAVDTFTEPRKLCNENFADAMQFVLSGTRAYGNSPTQDQIEEAKSSNWCNCAYEKIKQSAAGLEEVSVVEDMISIETLVKDESLLRGGNFSERQWSWFAQLLNHGETSRQIWGTSVLTCQLD